VSTDLFSFLRLFRVGFVLAREGALALVPQDVLPPFARVLVSIGRLIERDNLGNGAQRLAIALNRLGPSYVKFGQFLATRPDVVGLRVARDLESLQDRLPPFPLHEAAAIIEEALGKPVTELFVHLSEPVAAASIAQVHQATLHDGSKRAIKVLRPGIRHRFARDLEAMAFAAAKAESYSPEARRLRLGEVVNTLKRSVIMEMDLRLEAAALSEMAENTKDDPHFRVPEVVWDLTARDVLAMEWIDGTPLNDLETIDRKGHDRQKLGQTVIQSFLRHALRDGFFHADMHPGNLFVDQKGDLCAVDFGIMGRMGDKERRFLAEILLGFITRDYKRVAEVHFEAGYVPALHSVEEFAQAIRAIGEPIHNRRADEISMAKLLTLLFEITALFDMRTRTELVMLQKTMVVVEGVGRALDPMLDIWKTAEPVVREWITRNLGVIGRTEQAGRGALSFAQAVAALPSLVNRSEHLAETLAERLERGFPLDQGSIQAIGRAEGRSNSAGHLALWAIAIMIGLALFWI
jgi:ubiquinone biosynthesis protein